jgi:hypothetical protein
LLRELMGLALAPPVHLRQDPGSRVDCGVAHLAINAGHLIDKPHPLSFPNPAMATYAARYDLEYDRTPAVLHELDSLLTVIADHPSPADAFHRIGHLFWSNGHPNGAYIAREIVTAFGVDSLMPGARNPAAFLRTYAAAERKQGRPDPLSAKAWRVIERVEARYWHFNTSAPSCQPSEYRRDRSRDFRELT